MRFKRRRERGPHLLFLNAAKTGNVFYPAWATMGSFGFSGVESRTVAMGAMSWHQTNEPRT